MAASASVDVADALSKLRVKSEAPKEPRAESEAERPAVEVGAELRAILDVELKPSELLVIEAVAGAGKSTALREYARCWSGRGCLYLTFNVDLQAEALSYDDTPRRARRHRLG